MAPFLLDTCFVAAGSRSAEKKRGLGVGLLLLASSSCGSSVETTGTHRHDDEDLPGTVSQPGTSGPGTSLVPEDNIRAEPSAADPAAIADVADPVPDACVARRLSLGRDHECAITDTGHLYCWGLNNYRQVGVISETSECDDPDLLCETEPQRVASLENVVAVSAGEKTTCAVLDDGSAWCWGWGRTIGEAGGEMLETRCDQSGQPPELWTPCTEIPMRLTSIEHGIDADAWGGQCVLEREGTVKCWGGHNVFLPRTIPGVEGAVEVEHDCARTAAGDVLCWVVSGSATRWVWDRQAKAISKGYNQVCAIDTEDELYCWGLELTWSTGIHHCQGCTPHKVPELGPIAQVSGSLDVTWVRDFDGKVRMIDAEAVVHEAIDLPEPAIDIASGYHNACAVLESGSVYCWLNPPSTGSLVYRGIDLTTTPRQVPLCPE